MVEGTLTVNLDLSEPFSAIHFFDQVNIVSDIHLNYTIHLHCMVEKNGRKQRKTSVCGYLNKERSYGIMPAGPPGLLRGKGWRELRPHG